MGRKENNEKFAAGGFLRYNLIVLARLQADLKEAMKARDERRVSVLRMLLADFKNEKIKLGREPDEDESAALVKRAAKRRDEASESFIQGGRADLAEKERKEKTILEVYLPSQLSTEDIIRMVEAVIQALGASSPNDVGRVMGAFMKEHRATADGNVVRKIVAEKLGAPS